MDIARQMWSHKLRSVKTALCFLGGFNLGCCVLIIGPTLLDLSATLGVSLEEINIVYPIGAVGYCAGCLLVAGLAERINAQIYMAGVIFLMGFPCILLPWCPSVGLLGFLFFLINTGGSAMDGGISVWLLKLWGSESVPFLQLYQFFYGIGAFISPLMAEPFLSRTICVEAPIDNQIGINSSTLESNLTLIGNGSLCVESESRIWIAYAIAGALGVVNSLGFVAMYFIKPYDSPHETSKEKVQKKIEPCLKWTMIVVAGFYMMGFSCVSVVFPRYLTTFSVTSWLHLSKSTGAFMTSGFWVGYTAFRVVTVAFTKKIGPTRFMLMNSVLMLLGGVLTTFFSSDALQQINPVTFSDTHSNEIGMWIGIIMLGLGGACVWPAMYGYLEERMAVTGGVAAVLITVFSLGEFIYPFIIGAYLESRPMVLIYLTLASTMVSGIAFMIIHNVFSKKLNHMQANLAIGAAAFGPKSSPQPAEPC